MLEKSDIMASLRDMVLADDNQDVKRMALDLLLQVDRNLQENIKPYFNDDFVNKVRFIKFIREYLHGSDLSNIPRLQIKTSEFSDKQYASISLLNAKLFAESIMDYLATEYNK